MTMSAVLDAARGRGLSCKGREESRLRGVWRAWRGHEPIEMLERRHGYFPKVFIWRGCHYDVYAVERCWTVSRRKLGGRVERYVFRVRARSRSAESHDGGTFEIYQDVRHNTWHMQREVK